MWIELHSPSGKLLKTGYTPILIQISSGNQYIIYASNWRNTNVFNHWDDGSTNPYKTITPTQSVTLTAYYSISTDSTHGEHGKNTEKKQHDRG
ncbi:Uncharacterised protein [uncultured archaeon]|nr:Uncharacterised protein [uncultured archaeon]